LADKSGLDTTLWKRLQKVFVVALINALIAAIFAFGCSMLIDSGQIMLSVTVSLSLFAVVMLASLMGTVTPLVLNQLDINPAVASGPFITTTNDILGYGVYFIIVYFLL
jgi:magnesium transporter